MAKTNPGSRRRGKYRPLGSDLSANYLTAEAMDSPPDLLPGRTSLGQRDWDRLVIRPDDHARGLPLIKVVEAYREHNDDGAGEGFTGLNFGLRRKWGLRAHFECRKRLKIAVEIDRRDRVGSGRLAARRLHGAVNTANIERFLTGIVHREGQGGHGLALTGNFNRHDVVERSCGLRLGSLQERCDQNHHQ